ncbi:MAG: hypothetical protein C0490_12245 [Marivirga sp.]|nr:hypothetical protein [Marivirga sp.]
MRTISTQLLCTILLIIYPACTQEDVVRDEVRNCYPQPEMDNDNVYPLTRAWKLLWIENKITSNRTYPPCSRFFDNPNYLTLVFSADSNICGGIAAPNQYGGEYHITDTNDLSVDNVVRTLMGGPDEVIAFERKYFEALRELNHYEIDHNFLILDYNAGEDFLFFVAYHE